MAQTLSEYLSDHPARGFNPVPHYFATGDYLTYYFRPEPAFAQRVDDMLTVYLARDTQELVGCKIKGVRYILDTAGAFGVTVDDGQIKLGFFFSYGAVAAHGDAEKQRRYEELKRLAKDATIDRRQLQSA